MSKQMLSAAVDDAATAAEWDALIEAMDDDAALKDDWSRVWASRDARDGVQLAAGKNFCSGVMAAIATEKMLPSNVVAMPARRTARIDGRRRVPRQWRTVLPVSAAAGVMAAVLFLGDFKPPIGDGAVAEVAGNDVALASSPVSFRRSAADEAGESALDDAKSAVINAYLMEHSNSLAERSMGGTLANARFAARTANYRPDAQ